MIKRREFLRRAAATAGFALACKSSPVAWAQSDSDARVDVLLDEPLGTISPNIYGHFTENLSGVIYDGVWVGENSKIANIGGIRKELIDEMRKIKPAIVRYPGGCFADSYDWRDGVGPVEKRPRRTNFWNGGETPEAPAAHRYDPNRFGTNEFVQFCRLLDAQPYLAANLRSLPPQAFDRWVEYCNSPAGSTTLADQRAAAGFKEPINVHWQIMGEVDTDHHVKLVVDEWGPWYRPGSALTPTDQLEQLPTLRDAVFSGMTLDTFNRHPEKVGVACCAQLINCLNSLYLAHEDRFCVTPVGHVFQMYASHQGGQSLRANFTAPEISYDRDGKPASFWGLKGSASLHGKTLVLTADNPEVSHQLEARIMIRGAQAKSGLATVLTASDIH